MKKSIVFLAMVLCFTYTSPDTSYAEAQSIKLTPSQVSAALKAKTDLAVTDCILGEAMRLATETGLRNFYYSISTKENIMSNDGSMEFELDLTGTEWDKPYSELGPKEYEQYSERHPCFTKYTFAYYKGGLFDTGTRVAFEPKTMAKIIGIVTRSASRMAHKQHQPGVIYAPKVTLSQSGQIKCGGTHAKPNLDRRCTEYPTVFEDAARGLITYKGICKSLSEPNGEFKQVTNISRDTACAQSKKTADEFEAWVNKLRKETRSLLPNLKVLSLVETIQSQTACNMYKQYRVIYLPVFNKYSRGEVTQAKLQKPLVQLSKYIRSQIVIAGIQKELTPYSSSDIVTRLTGDFQSVPNLVNRLDALAVRILNDRQYVVYAADADFSADMNKFATSFKCN